ncbi:hypothetical protein AgCh_014067 [Apium graveolens]
MAKRKKPIRRGVIGHTLMVEESGRRKVNESHDEATNDGDRAAFEKEIEGMSSTRLMGDRPSSRTLLPFLAAEDQL